MPLFCLRRPEEWWGILQVCTRLSHLQPKRSIVRRLHMKFQEVWHFVSQTPANENNNKPNQKGCVIMRFMFRLSVLLLIFNFSSNESRVRQLRHKRWTNTYFLDKILKDRKRINPDQENPGCQKSSTKGSNIVNSKTPVEKWLKGWIRRWRKRKFRHICSNFGKNFNVTLIRNRFRD